MTVQKSVLYPLRTFIDVLLRMYKNFQRKSSALWIEMRRTKQITGYGTRFVRQANALVETVERCSSRYHMYTM